MSRKFHCVSRISVNSQQYARGRGLSLARYVEQRFIDESGTSPAFAYPLCSFYLYVISIYTILRLTSGVY
jgi:hypothetical protein